MASILSIHNRFLRVTPLNRFILRFTTSDSENPLKQRSASRFSVKVARFQFLRDRLHPSSSFSSHSHYTKSETQSDIHEIARNFVLSLEPEHRRILVNEITELEKSSNTLNNVEPILSSQLVVVFIETGLPYIGFGFVDNFVMLVAGETIETFFGAAFCLSTMAAAALGNAVSDVMGIGLADRIERTCGRFLAMFGIQAPKLTSGQWAHPSVQRTQLLSKVICIFVGCILGMCPLLIRDTSAKSSPEHDD